MITAGNESMQVRQAEQVKMIDEKMQHVARTSHSWRPIVTYATQVLEAWNEAAVLD